MSKIAQFVFHGLYSSKYSSYKQFLGGNGNDFFEYYDRSDIPIGPISARTGGHKDPLYFYNPEGSDEYKEGAKYKKFETEEEAVNYYNKSTFFMFSGRPEYLPSYKNYFKFPRKDFGKYRSLFHGMLKTSKITADLIQKYARTEVRMKLDPNPNYRPCPPTCPPVGEPNIINKKTFQFNSQYTANVVIDGQIFENDENFKDKIPLLNLNYFLNKDEETLSLSAGGEKIYKNKWEFNPDFFKNFFIDQLNFEFNGYPLDRTRLNQPVTTSPESLAFTFNTDNGSMQGLNIGGSVELTHDNINDNNKNLNSSNAGGITVNSSFNYDLNTEEFEQVFSTPDFYGIEFKVFDPEIYYIESTQEFIYFINFNFSLSEFGMIPSFVANRSLHLVGTNFELAFRDRTYPTSTTEETDVKFEKININLFIDGVDTVHQIEALQIKNYIWDDKNAKELASQISDGEEFTGNQNLFDGVLDLTSEAYFSNLNIYLNTWNEDNFGLENPFPAPLSNTNV
jgi:hypothetical protein